MVRAAELHDVGKVAVPDAILQKRSALEPGERRDHRAPLRGGRAHPRRRPGDGPRGAARALKPRALRRARLPRQARAARQIPVGARIIAVCDAFHAMTSRPPLRARDRHRGRRSPSSTPTPARSSTPPSSTPSAQSSTPVTCASQGAWGGPPPEQGHPAEQPPRERRPSHRGPARLGHARAASSQTPLRERRTVPARAARRGGGGVRGGDSSHPPPPSPFPR